MSWDDVRSAVSKVAPILGSAFGPVGTVAGSIVAAALGTSEDPDEIIKAISADPEAAIKLKQAEMDHKVQLVQIAAEREKNALAASTSALQTAASDRANAREYAIRSSDNTARNLAYLYTIGFFATLGTHLGMLIAGVAIDPTAATLINVLEGILTAMVLGSKEYFFGSSSGDARKSLDISQIAKSE